MKITSAQKRALVEAMRPDGFRCSLANSAPAVKLIKLGLATYVFKNLYGNGTLIATMAGRALLLKQNARVMFQGTPHNGIESGRKGIVIGEPDKANMVAVSWDDPDPVPECYVAISGESLTDLLPIELIL